MGQRILVADVLRRRPITTPSSTSQSVFSDPRGSTIGSFGPHSDDVAFRNRIGSGGSAIPASAA
jgi:hypothetical protein